jgi:hypothetical protein
MTTATASGQVEERRWWGKVMSRLSKVFELNPQGLHWGRGVMFLDIALVPFVVLSAIGQQGYLLSAIFGALVAAAVDPGGAYGRGAPRCLRADRRVADGTGVCDRHLGLGLAGARRLRGHVGGGG